MRAAPTPSSTLVALLCVQLVFGPLAHAQSRAETPAEQIRREERVIPKAPSTPAPLMGAKPPSEKLGTAEEPFRCPRYFSYRGTLIQCDSNTSWDGEALRPILSGTPSALYELNQYQATRERAQVFKYIAGAGLLLALAGIFVRGFMGPEKENRDLYRNIGVIGGLSLTASSYAFSLIMIKVNERRLERAVSEHNRAHPNDPIELQFSTGFSF